MTTLPPGGAARQISLQVAPLNTKLTFLGVEGSPPLRRRLSALGFRRGAPFEVVQRVSGGGRIVSIAGARIALGRDLLASAFAEEAQ